LLYLTAPLSLFRLHVLDLFAPPSIMHA
jgi:hypothetical protein